MMKLTVTYTTPSDPDAFNAHYTSVHAPMVRTMPGLDRFESGQVVGTPDGSDAPFFRTAELYFADQDAMGKAFGSEEGMATGQDAAELCARTGATMATFISVLD
jgi:uncharacterized protein (TIGR02118 family)